MPSIETKMMEADMSPILHNPTNARPTVPALWWLAIIAAVAATLLLISSTVSFQGLDRLLPAGEPFLPYFTT
jgi:membrane protein YqaA with SNARE-associated domain